MIFVETPNFTRSIRSLLTDDDYPTLQQKLASDPDLGIIIVGGGGIRKLRWAASSAVKEAEPESFITGGFRQENIDARRLREESQTRFDQG